MNPEQIEAYMNQRPSSLSTAAKTALLSGGAGYGIDAGMGLMSGAGKQSFKAAIPSAVVSGGAGAGISLVQSAMRKKEMNRMMTGEPFDKQANDFSNNQIKNIPTKGVNNTKNEDGTKDSEREEAERKKKINAAAFPVALGTFSGALSGAEHAQDFHRPILKEMSKGGLVGGAVGAATIPLSLYTMKKNEERLKRKILEREMNKQANILSNARRALNSQVKGGLF